MESKLRTQSERLFYYSKSADKKPGKGANEYTTDVGKYDNLSNIKDWRKILSNFYVSPFTWKGKKWNSVEHAFQGTKIALVDPTKGNWFTLDSGNKIGQGDGLEARKNRKLVFLGPKDLEKWDSMKSGIMEDILHAKFSQVPLAKKVLLETGDAELWHSPGRAPAERQYELESVRDRLKSKEKQKISTIKRSRSPSPKRKRSPSPKRKIEKLSDYENVLNLSDFEE
jgi:predicted NAD-dependent protein-ADP-ribosyltransferase YbiA (DUF1768 family)